MRPLHPDFKAIAGYDVLGLVSGSGPVPATFHPMRKQTISVFQHPPRGVRVAWRGLRGRIRRVETVDVVNRVHRRASLHLDAVLAECGGLHARGRTSRASILGHGSDTS